MSASGSPFTATRSAYRPGCTEPTRSDQPNKSAAFTVAVWIACIGVSPHSTIFANCLPFHPCG
jgi:hypothetical protein